MKTARRHTQIPETEYGENHRNDQSRGEALADKKTEQRHDHNIERSDETGFADFGIVKESELLQGFAPEQAQSAEQTADKKIAFVFRSAAARGFGTVILF